MRLLSELPKQRKFLPPNFRVTVWSKLKPYYVELEHREISNKAQLEEWLRHMNELQAIIYDDFSMRAFILAQDNTDQKARDGYLYAIKELLPRVEEYNQVLNNEYLNSPFFSKLPRHPYEFYTQLIKNRTAGFRPENLSLDADIQSILQTYASLLATIRITDGNDQLSLSQAMQKLGSAEREVRSKFFSQINRQLARQQHQFNTLLDQLLALRQQKAQNAEFDNFRNYYFQEQNQLIYSPEECHLFREMVVAELLPVVEKIDEIRMAYLDVEQLHPYDLNPALLPVEQSLWEGKREEFLQKTVHCLQKLSPDLAEGISFIDVHHKIDLEARPNKHLGIYCNPILSFGIPHLSLHPRDTFDDLHQFMEVCGKGLHALFTAHLDLCALKNLPVVLTQLSASSIQLISTIHWDGFFTSKNELLSAKLFVIEQCLRKILFSAAMDEFQHWIYSHPGHHEDMRHQVWKSINRRFTSKHVVTDESEVYWNGDRHVFEYIFEAPFQSVERGVAGLGAIEIWQQYSESGTGALNALLQAMQTGYTRPVSQLYQMAGTRLDITRKRVKNLSGFMRSQYNRLLQQTTSN